MDLLKKLIALAAALLLLPGVAALPAVEVDVDGVTLSLPIPSGYVEMTRAHNPYFATVRATPLPAGYLRVLDIITADDAEKIRFEDADAIMRQKVRPALLQTGSVDDRGEISRLDFNQLCDRINLENGIVQRPSQKPIGTGDADNRNLRQVQDFNGTIKTGREITSRTTNLLRIRGRLLEVSVNGDKDIGATRALSQTWVDAILAANPPSDADNQAEEPAVTEPSVGAEEGPKFTSTPSKSLEDTLILAGIVLAVSIAIGLLTLKMWMSKRR